VLLSAVDAAGRRRREAGERGRGGSLERFSHLSKEGSEELEEN